MIFSGGEYQSPGLTQFPVRLVPSLWGATDEVRKRVASELHSLAVISLPAVVVEDTHPAPIQLPPGIRRVLLVRPTSFEYLVRLNERYSAVYSAYLLCDSPDSPTWPYDEAQTRQLAGWKKWHVIGPVYRTPAEDEIRQVRARYNLVRRSGSVRLQHGRRRRPSNDPQGQDFVRFLRRRSASGGRRAAPRIASTRCSSSRDPIFRRESPSLRNSRLLPDEDQMPALLKIAKAAVIRAGFNTTWECIAAGTPFMPLIGTTYAEPVTERVNRLSSFGLVPPNIESLWFDDNVARGVSPHRQAGLPLRTPGCPNHGNFAD